jgi:hypothetical protein
MDKGETREEVWNCQSVDVPHSRNLVHEVDVEDGVPFYEAQQQGPYGITVCSSCHSRLPGHIINIEPDNIESYFEYESPDNLFDALPQGYSSSGSSRTYRQRIFESLQRHELNLFPTHAGQTLKLCLAYQWNRDEWLPAAHDELVREVIGARNERKAEQIRDWREKY